MSDTIVPTEFAVDSAPCGAWSDCLCASLTQRSLSGLRHGQVTLIDSGERHTFGACDPAFPFHATIDVRNPAFYSMLVLGGHLGAAEAFIRGYWTSSDLTTLVRIFLRNADVMNGFERVGARILSPFRKLLYTLQRNTREGSRRNIAAHYDLGNDFFSLMLDETMMYSCGIFERPDATLQEASVAKLDRICRKMRLGPSDHLLEIGTGWGGFALHAASRYGCCVTTTTISRQQYELARERIARAGLSDRVTLLLEDYRDLRGQYDKLVSIEMIEAVGHAFYDTFFATCAKLLKPDGLMLLQAITIQDQHYDISRRDVDFIKKYIFPGSCIPSITALLGAATRGSDLRLFHHEDITPHYAETLRCWRDNFRANLDEVRALGYPETFIRMWEFYLAYCEGGFRERFIGDVHMVLTRPMCRAEPILPTLESPATPTCANV